MSFRQNKRKIINDPVYGFITLTDALLFDLIEHPWFQRLRRIKQLGLTHLVYPGALHTRFHHALGAMYLTKQAVDSLRLKGIDISPEEERGVLMAILLHDIGHGPFSHALEHTLVQNWRHEDLSLLYMEALNRETGGALETALAIFQNQYPKQFLHQLVSSQLDMDRMDYLKRDSFYTGVSEGVINSDRLLHMLTVSDDTLMVEAKGIYSVEKFIVARRLMYWQVYLHKTVLAAEKMLVSVLRRARFLAETGRMPFATPALARFLNPGADNAFDDPARFADHFGALDDSDISACIKVWATSNDPILALLSHALTHRRLFRIEMQKTPFDPEYGNRIRRQSTLRYDLPETESEWIVYQGEITNNAYTPRTDRILILHRNGHISDISEDSDQLNVSVLSEQVTRHFLIYPKF